jgi:hypothetical protein
VSHGTVLTWNAAGRKSLLGFYFVVEGTVPAALRTTCATLFEIFSSEDPLAILDVVIEAFDEWMGLSGIALILAQGIREQAS